MSISTDLTAAQRKALAEVSAKQVVYISERNQTPEFEGTKARTDTLDVLISRGLIERGERTNHPGGFTAVVNVTPAGRAALDEIAAAEKAASKPTPKTAEPKPARPKADSSEPTEEEANVEGLTLNADTEPKADES